MILISRAASTAAMPIAPATSAPDLGDDHDREHGDQHGAEDLEAVAVPEGLGLGAARLGVLGLFEVIGMQAHDRLLAAQRAATKRGDTRSVNSADGSGSGDRRTTRGAGGDEAQRGVARREA